MLITTFSSGELSKNLYGRSDLPQYYSGAARLENFDVIPTGGIKRRSGTERVLPLGAEGRLIPFNVDRENHFLLYLTPGKIQAVKNGQIQNTFESSNALKLYEDLDEIREVQYAQDFDTMILCHENYPPLIAKVDSNRKITISMFSFEFSVEIKGEIYQYRYNEDDSTYLDSGWLQKDYPRCASFFSGRLFFAGTKNEPQRIFASSTGNIHNFSTYKLFQTEKRDYFTVLSTIADDHTIKIETPEIPLRFVKPINEYFIDSIYFAPGSRIEKILGDTITINHEIEGLLFDKKRIEEEMNAKKDAFNDSEKKEQIKLYPDNNLYTEAYSKNVVEIGRVTFEYVPNEWRYHEKHFYYLRYGTAGFQIDEKYGYDKDPNSIKYSHSIYKYDFHATTIADSSREELLSFLYRVLDSQVQSHMYDRMPVSSIETLLT